MIKQNDLKTYEVLKDEFCFMKDKLMTIIRLVNENALIEAYFTIGGLHMRCCYNEKFFSEEKDNE